MTTESYFSPRLSGFFVFLLISVILISAIAIIFLDHPVSQSLAQIPTPSSAIPLSWQTYINTQYNYTFKYPDTLGKGALCDGDAKQGLIRLGANLLKYPYADCGTGNIPSDVMFYTNPTYSPHPGYQIRNQKTLFFGNISGQYYRYQNQGQPKIYGNEYALVVIPLKDRQTYLIGETNRLEIITTFDQILSSFKFIDQNLPANKSCNQDQDCTLLACNGCFNRDWVKTAPPDLACMTYSNYTCICIGQACIENPPPHSVTTAIDSPCKKDSECVIGIKPQDCCNCPQAVSVNNIGKDRWEVYQYGKNYSINCHNDIQCQPCPNLTQVMCQNNHCRLLDAYSQSQN
jgi:hypothetical protein